MTRDERRRVHAAMVRFADGDRTAFRDVFDALWPVLLGVCARSLANRADAEDAAQRAMLKVFDRIVDLDPRRDGVAWAVTIAGYEVLTARRQQLRRREAGAAVDVVDAGPSVEDAVIAEDLRDAVRDVIARLPQRDQDALGGLLLGDTPRGEAERKRRFRAIDRLRSAWRKAHG
jgi:RNA polymerase sigma-70 factor (ECF subfamily)